MCDPILKLIDAYLEVSLSLKELLPTKFLLFKSIQQWWIHVGRALLRDDDDTAEIRVHATSRTVSPNRHSTECLTVDNLIVLVQHIIE